MSKYAFGVDIGGTTVKLGLFGEDGSVLEKWEIPTDKKENGEHILPDVAASIEKKLAEKKIVKDEVIGVGVGAPGPIDSEGTVNHAVNLGWGVFNIPEKLKRTSGTSGKGCQ